MHARNWRRIAVWSLLVLVSAALHLWQLDERSFHHDESIHAHSSYELVKRGVYRYNPTYHGPLLYYLTAASYLFLGDSDFSARLPIAVAGMPAIVELQRKRQMRGHTQLPMTRVWAATGTSGVPFGVHTAWLSIKTNGWPFDWTRSAATTHCPVTQGTGLPETLNGQPAIA